MNASKIFVRAALILLPCVDVIAQETSWTVVVDENPLTDELVTVASVVSEDATGVFGVTCGEGFLFASLFNPSIPQGAGEGAQVRWRIDRETLKSEVWQNRDRMVVKVLESTDALLEAASRAQQRLVIESSGITQVFPVDGSSTALAVVQTACEQATTE